MNNQHLIINLFIFLKIFKNNYANAIILANVIFWKNQIIIFQF